MLNERTQAKIGIINTDAKKIASALLECIAPENLPRQYGGSCPLDLGESEEEADLRAYVASIAGGGGSAAPAGTAPGRSAMGEEDGDDEVEVDLRAAAGPAKAAAARAGAAAAARDGIPEPPGALPGGGGSGEVKTNGAGPGAARRVFGSVRGALGWAGGKLAWRRSPVAHLGDENGYEYDAEQQRWVLRGETAGGGSGGRARAGGGAGLAPGEGGDSGGRGGDFRPMRLDRDRSVSSEEMTVLAIQVCFPCGCAFMWREPLANSIADRRHQHGFFFGGVSRPALPHPSRRSFRAACSVRRPTFLPR